MIKADYLYFQKRLQDSQLFRYFWQFWANYAFVIFIAAMLLIFATEDYQTVIRPIIILSFVSFVFTRAVVIWNINLHYERERPYQKFRFTPITSKFFSYKTALPNSFPSRHAAAYFSVASVVGLFSPEVGALLVAASLIGAVARVVLGYHWPSDVIGGMIIGSAVGYFFVWFGYPALFT